MEGTMTFSSFILSLGSLIVSVITNVKHSKCSKCIDIDNRSNPTVYTSSESPDLSPDLSIEVSESQEKFKDISIQTNIKYQDNFTQTNIKFKDVSVQTQKMLEII